MGVDGMRTRWFDLDSGELAVLLAGAALVLLGLAGMRALRVALWRGEFHVEGARQALTAPVRLDVNTARPYELQLLPGIGEKTARAIVASREQQGPYRRLEELMRVPGIGPRTVERLRPHLMCAPPESGER